MSLDVPYSLFLNCGRIDGVDSVRIGVFVKLAASMAISWELGHLKFPRLFFDGPKFITMFQVLTICVFLLTEYWWSIQNKRTVVPFRLRFGTV